MNSILQKIAEHKQQEIEIAKRQKPLSSFADLPKNVTRDFVDALQQPNPAIIAEIKKASPSKGVIRGDFNVATIAAIYEQHGAACLSVLTDKQFFQGDISYINVAKEHATLPVLRKDFIIDSYQIDESRALGADCILLIVAMLDDTQLRDFCEHAIALDMAVLVESHSREELERALPLPTPLMGVNNRSLHTFVTNTQVSINLAKGFPSDKMLITESGINTRDDVLLMQQHGITRFLIGESLMRADDIGLKMQELIED
ncbi:MAG: indole-3-glycerol phosphate synthase TrpC [Legionella sp.]|nr:indole-3-glycerol phosphate synthase TrpC [Legionella sp.]